MNEYTSALCGGAVIGISASMLLVSHGKILGVSGIVGRLFGSQTGDKLWRVYFLTGMLLGGLASSRFFPMNFPVVQYVNDFSTAIAGLLVGFGTQLGNGCTSGHGVCGMSRLSLRSILATSVFILSGIVTVALYGI